VIVVIGDLLGQLEEARGIEPAGFAATLASAAAAAGSDVQVVARIGDDDIGDAVLLGLAARHVGHVATLRDPSRRTALVAAADVDNLGEDQERPDRDVPDPPTLDAADVGLALRYLADYRVIAVTHTIDPELVREVSSAAGWAGAHLVVVTPPGSQATSLPDGALLISAEHDAESLAERLGRYAAAVDAGESANTAYAVLTEANAES
jgi:sugar/nucleoside kinase (ribokinase family)